MLSAVFTLNISHELFHSIFEHDAESHATCTVEDEENDCHRYLVHHIKSEQCDGDHDHFAEAGEKCFKCEFFKEKQKYSLTDETHFAEFIPQRSDIVSVPAAKANSNLFSQFLRGPPAAL
jgi:hypothetical protein